MKDITVESGYNHLGDVSRPFVKFWSGPEMLGCMESTDFEKMYHSIGKIVDFTKDKDRYIMWKGSFILCVIPEKSHHISDYTVEGARELWNVLQEIGFEVI
jgi:hypothetical protein